MAESSNQPSQRSVTSMAKTNKPMRHIEYHRGGSVWAWGQTAGGVPTWVWTAFPEPARGSRLRWWCGIGALPIFGIAHGHIQWTSAYAIYRSGKLK